MARFRKIAGITALILVSIVVLLFGTVYIFSDQIKREVIRQVNTQLATKVDVGEVYFSIFENFPKASVTFRNIRFTESAKIKNQPLAEFEKVSITLNFWDAVNRNIKIQSIRFMNGSLQAAVDKKGQVNFEVIKTNDTAASAGSTDFSFKYLVLENVYLSYESAADSVFTEMDVDEINCSGSFTDKSYDLALDGIFKVSLKTGSREWLSNRSMEMNTTARVDNEKGEIFFDKTQLKLEDMLFQFDGAWKLKGESGKVHISTPGLEIQHLVSLLPSDWGNSATEYKSSGELSLKATLEKEKNKDLAAEASFLVKDGSLYIAEFDEGVKDIQLKGSLVLNDKKQELVLDQAEARLMQDLFRVNGKIAGFTDPYLDLSLLGNINLANLKRVVNLGKYNNSSGFVKMDFSVKGKMSDLENPQAIDQVFLDGKLDGKDLQIGDSTVENRLKDMDVSISLNKVTTTIHRLKTTWNNNTFEIKGEADNLLAYLFNEKNVLIRGELKADHLRFENPSEEAKKDHQADSSSINFPPRIALSARVDVGLLEFDNFHANDIVGNVKVNDNVMEIRDLHLLTCKGDLTLKGRWQKRDNGDNHIVLSSSLRRVDIAELFREANNFGQQELTDKNLKGLLTGDVDLAFLTDRFFELKPKSLYSFIKLKIENGELNNYEPIKALSRFVKMKDLENIRFQTLSNEIEIQDETIFIPQMEIKNSALNFFMEGTHTFSNFLKYSIKMQLRDLMAGSYASTHEPDEFETVEQGVNLFIKMEGPVDDLKFSYDKKEAKKSFRQDMKTEKQNVKELLRKEFGIQKKDSNTRKNGGNTGGWEDDIPE